MNHVNGKEEEAMEISTDDPLDKSNNTMANAINGEVEEDGEEKKSPEEEMDEDDSKAEATFSFTVENISKLKESVLSPKCMVRNLPWKIMAMQRINHSADKYNQKSLGFFLQCNAESDSTSWSCNAAAELKILNQKKDGEDFTRKIQHLFYSKENDWGYSHFLPWNELLDPDKGYCKDDKITLQVHVIADAPHGVRLVLDKNHSFDSPTWIYKYQS